MDRCSKLPYQLAPNADALGYKNIVYTNSHTRQKERDATPPLQPTSDWLDTPGLAGEAFAKYGGRPPSKEMRGKCSLAVPWFEWNTTKEDTGVAYPANIRPSCAKLATLLQVGISKAFRNDLLYPPTFPSAGEEHKGSTLLKIEGRPWISIKWKKTADMQTMWSECMGHLNASLPERQQQSIDTVLKSVNGLGYSVHQNKGTLTFDIKRWNLNCYRIAHCGVSKRMGSQPNIAKNLLSDIPPFYKDFGKEVETGFDLLTRALHTRIEKKEMATCSEILLDLKHTTPDDSKRKRGFFQPPASKKGKGHSPRLSSRKGKGKG